MKRHSKAVQLASEKHTKKSCNGAFLITAPVKSIASQIAITRFVKVIEPSLGKLFLVAHRDYRKDVSDAVELIGLTHNPLPTLFKRSLSFAILQLRISGMLIKFQHRYDTVMLYVGARDYLIPLLVSKILRKRSLLVLTGFTTKFRSRGNLSNRILVLADKLNFKIVDKIIVFGHGMIGFFGLENYKQKIVVAPKDFVDMNLFYPQKSMRERKNLGFVGRLETIKGILNLIRGFSLSSSKNSGYKLTVVGDGVLRNEVEKTIIECDIEHSVDLVGEVPNESLPQYLNEMKLLVVASYSEGLPKTIVEAMACGTPVLATSVGAIPDVIKDGETGFIMADNSSRCIADNIDRALNHPKLEEIAQNARVLVDRKFTYEKAVDRYREILASL